MPAIVKDDKDPNKHACSAGRKKHREPNLVDEGGVGKIPKQRVERKRVGYLPNSPPERWGLVLEDLFFPVGGNRFNRVVGGL